MTKYDLFRRRIGPVAFGLAIVLMARDACGKQERTHATIALDYGAAEPRIRSIDAEVWSEGEPLATFHRDALPGHHIDDIGQSSFKILSTSKDGELRFDVELAPDLGSGGAASSAPAGAPADTVHRKFSRRYHADEDATVTIPLESDLR